MGGEFERVAVYARISKKEASMGEKVEGQLAELRAFAKSNGWTVTGEYADLGVSAYLDKKRPEFYRMLAAIRAGQHDAVLTINDDRLHRSDLSRMDMFEACKVGGLIHIISPSTHVRLDTADGRKEYRDRGSAAQHQSDRASERIRRYTNAWAERGEPKRGGLRAFGFEADGKTVREDEAALIRDAARRITKGASVLSIVRDWASRGVRTPITGSRGGNEWAAGNLRRMLLNPRYAGRRVHQGEVVGDATWPTIIDRPTYQKLDRILRNPDRVRPSRGRRYLLRGLIVCGVCGTRLIARPRTSGARVRRYVCSKDVPHNGCGSVGTVALPVEEFVCRWADGMLGHLSESPFAVAEVEAEPGRESELYGRLREYEDRRREFSEDRADGGISRTDYRAGIARIDAAEKTIKRELAEIQHPARGLSWAQLVESARPFDDPAAWTEEDWEWWRALIEATVERVIIQPSKAARGSKVFDARRIEIVAAVGPAE